MSYSLYIIRKGTPKDTVQNNIDFCRRIVKHHKREMNASLRKAKKSEAIICKYEKRIADYKALSIVNGKVVK